MLSDGNRANAIAALARAKRFGPSIGEDAALALKGATQGSRATAVAEIAPYLRDNLPGQALAAIVGPASDITDGNRANAIAAIARSVKKPAPISGFDGGAILEGATQGSRASAIAELAPLFKADLSGQEAAAILGSPNVLSDGNRANAIAALIKAGKLSAAFTDHLPSAASAEVNRTTLTTSENASSAQLDAAKKYWIYAAMSNNVYGNKMVELPIGWQSLNAKYGDHGFYAETFIRKEHGKIKDIVVAFRGTEGVVDWALGNLINLQQGDANEYVGEAIAKLGRFSSVTLTGHSLGGALAQNVANNIGLSAIVFDSSPMDGFEYPTGGGGKNISISEQGEALALIRTSLRADVIFNFINDDEGKIENHKMYPLAAGIKLLAQPTNN